jgi:hypothetical protein
MEYGQKRVHRALAVGIISAAVLTATAGLSQVHAATNNDVTISNGGLSVTFDLSWGAVVTGISNTNVGGGLNIVDSHDVGRELQTDQFLYQTINGTEQLMINPTQAGAYGGQAFYQHPNGVTIAEVGSPVVSYTATANTFHAVITPLDYDTGNPTDWIYVENVSINSQGVANFSYTNYDYQPETYNARTEVPTLYSDYTDAFMLPTSAGGSQTITGSPTWPQHTTSGAWVGNLDTTNNVGLFYTTPTGLAESYGTFSGVSITPGSSPPLGKTNVVGTFTAVPGTVLTSSFSVVAGTQTTGPTQIAQRVTVRCCGLAQSGG